MSVKYVSCDRLGSMIENEGGLVDPENGLEIKGMRKATIWSDDSVNSAETAGKGLER